MKKAKRIRWDGRAGVAVNARGELPRAAARYFGDVRQAIKKEPDAADLHPIRLRTKRLRYTLELFRPCYGPGLDKRLSELRRVQQMLGDIQDCIATAEYVTKITSPSPRRQQARKFLDELAESRAREFRKYWAEVFDAAGREAWWTDFLRRQARTPPKRAWNGDRT